VERYHVDTTSHYGPFRVQARLMFQSVRPAFVGSLHGSDNPRVDRFLRMYEMVPPTPELLAEATREQ
jgi:hypothetical protein